MQTNLPNYVRKTIIIEIFTVLMYFGLSVLFLNICTGTGTGPELCHNLTLSIALLVGFFGLALFSLCIIILCVYWLFRSKFTTRSDKIALTVTLLFQSFPLLFLLILFGGAVAGGMG